MTGGVGREPRLSLPEALALGALHGPAELLPISSSGHIELVPWLLGWSYPELDGELRKAFGVALHAGTAAALLITERDEVRSVATDLSRHRLTQLGLSFVPPALVGFALERPIERRLGTAGSIAFGLLMGSAVMVWADRSPQERSHGDAGPADALWLGFAQACALMPGVSRGGATLAAARRRRFRRADAGILSRHSALPVIAGATALKGLRLTRRGLPAGARLPFAAGAVASFASTLATSRLLRRDRGLVLFAAYRVALAAVTLRHASLGAFSTSAVQRTPGGGAGGRDGPGDPGQSSP